MALEFKPLITLLAVVMDFGLYMLSCRAFPWAYQARAR